MFKKIFKVFCLIALITVMVLSVAVIDTGAVTAKSTIGVSNTTPKVGSTITITVRFNISVEMQAIEGTLTYDSAKLQFVSAGGSFISNTSGNPIKFSATGNSKNYTEQYQFKVIAEGNATVSLVGLCSDTEEFKVDSSSFIIKAKAAQDTNTSSATSQNTNANTKAALTSIKVAAGTLTPAFKENITEYTVVVPYTQTDGLLTCEALDKSSNISVEGDRELKVGLNKRTIVVVAPNGDTRRYTVTFNRLDENGNDTTVAANDGTTVMVDGKEFTISENNASVTAPKGFNLTTVTYKEKEVAAYSDTAGKVTIVYLVAKDGSEEGFYILEQESFKNFYFIECGDVCYVIKEDEMAAPDGFFKTTYEINGKNLPCYKYTSQEYSDFIVVSAVSSGGNEGYYRFDVKENTMQRYPDFINGAVAANSEDNGNVTSSARMTVIVLVVIFALGIIALIVLIIIKIACRTKIAKEEDEEVYRIDMDSDSPTEDNNF